MTDEIKDTGIEEERKTYKRSERYQADDPLDEAIAALIFEEPWYGIFIQHFERRRVPSLKSHNGAESPAAVFVMNNQVTLVVNEKLFNEFSLEQRMGIIKHECLHIVNKHIIRSDDRSPAGWNIATDIAINQFVGKKNLPEGVCFHDEPPFSHIPGMAAGLASEKYYELLKNEAQKQGGGCNQSMGSDRPQGGESECDKDCSKCPMNSQDTQGNSTCPHKKNNPNQGKGASGKDKQWTELDSHAGWASESDGANDKEAIESDIKQAAKETSDAIIHAGRGTVPGEVQEAIDKLCKPTEIRWQDILRNFISDSYEVYRRHSFHRESRRIDGIYPGTKRYPKYHPIVAVDTSGSVSDFELQLMLNECKAICDQLEIEGFELWQFDAGIQDCGMYDPHKTVRIHGRGGTDFQPVLNKARKENKPSIIIMTDGGAPAPEMRNVKVYWALTEGMYNNGDHLEGPKVTIKVPKPEAA